MICFIYLGLDILDYLQLLCVLIPANAPNSNLQLYVSYEVQDKEIRLFLMHSCGHTVIHSYVDTSSIWAHTNCFIFTVWNITGLQNPNTTTLEQSIINSGPDSVCMCMFLPSYIVDYLVPLSGLYYFIVVVLVSLFKSYIQIVVWYLKGSLWTFFSVHACVILGDICYSTASKLTNTFLG